MRSVLVEVLTAAGLALVLVGCALMWYAARMERP